MLRKLIETQKVAKVLTDNALLHKLIDQALAKAIEMEEEMIELKNEIIVLESQVNGFDDSMEMLYGDIDNGL